MLFYVVSYYVLNTVGSKVPYRTRLPALRSQSIDILLDLINKRNIAFKNRLKCPSQENSNKLREARHQLLREKCKAKRKWQFQYTEKCKKKDIILNPKEAWNMVFKLIDRFQKHHKNILQKKIQIQSRYQSQEWYRQRSNPQWPFLFSV